MRRRVLHPATAQPRLGRGPNSCGTSLLALLWLADSAGDELAGAKILIASGQVTVNGEPELRRGRLLHPGYVVHVGTDDLRIVAA